MDIKECSSIMIKPGPGCGKEGGERSQKRTLITEKDDIEGNLVEYGFLKVKC